MKEQPKESVFKGVCCFHSETGTEGGYWAFQDEKFMDISDNTEICHKCGYLRDYVEKLHPEAVIQVVQMQTLEDALKGNQQKMCIKNAHTWELLYPKGKWSYEGLHILKDGDKLTIYSPGKQDEVVWEGIILLKYFPVFSQCAFGMWIHSDQIGIEREVWAKWFMDEYPAKLETKGGEKNE